MIRSDFLPSYLISAIYFSILLCCFSCKSENTVDNNKTSIVLPKTPEAVCRAWQTYLDNNEIAKAMLLGSPKAKIWLKNNQALFLEDDELEPTQFAYISCSQKKEKAICKYSIQEEGDMIEDFFTLIRINNQWLIDIEEQEQEGVEEAMFNEMKKSLELN